MKQMKNEKSESKSANLTNIKNRYSSTKMVREKKVGCHLSSYHSLNMDGGRLLS